MYYLIINFPLQEKFASKEGKSNHQVKFKV